MSKKDVVLRSGEIVEVSVNSPTLLKIEAGRHGNGLEYIKDCSLAVGGLDCEKYDVHGLRRLPPATNYLRVKFTKGEEFTMIVCADCARRIKDEYAPYSNTGLTSPKNSEEG